MSECIGEVVSTITDCGETYDAVSRRESYEELMLDVLWAMEAPEVESFSIVLARV